MLITLSFISRFGNYVISIRTGELIPKECLPQDDLEASKSSCIQIEGNLLTHETLGFQIYF